MGRSGGLLVGSVLSLRLEDKRGEVCEAARTTSLQIILLVELVPVWVFDCEVAVFPANTQRRYNVAATSRRCSDVVTTLL